MCHLLYDGGFKTSPHTFIHHQATCGDDSIVRVWNNVKTSRKVSPCSITQHFPESPSAVAMHPEGYGTSLSL